MKGEAPAAGSLCRKQYDRNDWRRLAFSYLSGLGVLTNGVSAEEYRELTCGRGLFIKNSAICHINCTTRHLSIRDNQRVTTDQPAIFENHIYLMGASLVFCPGSPDTHTIASFLQRGCNAVFPNRYRVVNLGTKGTKIPNCWLQLRSLPLQPGDHALLIDTLNINARQPFFEYVLGMARYCRERECGFFFFRYPNVCDVRSPSTHERILASHSYQDLCETLAGGDQLCPGPPLPSRERRYADIWEKLKVHPWVHDLQPLFDRPHPWGEVFFDMTHVANKGNQAIAEGIIDVLRRPSPAPPLPAVSERHLQRRAVRYLQSSLQKHHAKNGQLRKWLEKIPAHPIADGKTVGAIVMNCNPFTNGHAYLIEAALQNVDYLYVFAVQEDLSIFPFRVRLRLMREGTKHVADRILLVASGKFIISAFSFPGYFTKEKTPVPVDASMDVAVFGAVIAPALRITRRFVGEEPFCVVTREYNRIMRDLLPGMGVALHVIPRMEQDGTPVSASQVRALLKAGDMEGVRRLVPEATYRYLRRIPRRTKLLSPALSFFHRAWARCASFLGK